MKFEDAFALLKKHPDNYMRMDNWQYGDKVKIQYPDAMSKITTRYLYIENACGLFHWTPNSIDIFSDEWKVFMHAQ
jgi:hypothetical protein